MPLTYYMDYMTYVLLTKVRSRSEFFLFALLRTETKLRSIKMHKKYEAYIQPS